MKRRFDRTIVCVHSPGRTSARPDFPVLPTRETNMKYSQTMKLDLGFRRMNKKHMQECAASTNLSLHLDVGDSYLCAAEFHSATWGDNDPNWCRHFLALYAHSSVFIQPRSRTLQKPSERRRWLPELRNRWHTATTLPLSRRVSRRYWQMREGAGATLPFG